MSSDRITGKKKKLLYISAASVSLRYLLKGRLRYMNRFFEVTGVASPDRLLTDVGKTEGVRTIGIPITRSIDLPKDLVSLWRLICLFSRERPDIVHSLTPKAGLLSMLAAKITGVPNRIHSFTGLIFPYRTGFMYHLLKNMDRITCACATVILPEGRGVKKDLTAHGVTRKRLRIIGNGNINGIDTREFSRIRVTENQIKCVRDRLNIRRDDFVFVFVGRVVKDKGINELVSAFINMSAARPEIKLILVGPREPLLDPLDAATEKRIAENPRIMETGWVDDVRPFLAVGDVFVFPSYREGFPNVVIQAGAMGLASIVTDISGSNEIIISGENGVIVPPKDAAALADAMSVLFTDEDKRKKMSVRARPMIAARYEQRFIWSELLTMYQKLRSR